MRIVSVVAAYATIALIVLLVLLYPNRPATLISGLMVLGVLTVIVGVFDMIGQAILDNQQLKQLPSIARLLIFVCVIGAFFGATYAGLQIIDPTVSSWTSSKISG